MTERPHEATFTFRCRSEADARALRSAIAVEVQDAAGGTVVHIDEATPGALGFTLRIEAELLGNLRAASRTSMQCLIAASGALDASS